jgi:thiol-disulfide isomerase/thioredoxin
LGEAREEIKEREKVEEKEPPGSMPDGFAKRVAAGKAASEVDLDLMEGHAQLALGNLEPAHALLARAREGFDRLAELPLGEESLGQLGPRYSELRERLAEARGVDPSALDLPPVEAEESMEPAELLAALWNELDEPLEPFQLQDLEGRTWTVDDLKGRTTLINIWATWCGPCRAELPHIQELHEEWKERDDVRVITFDMDHSIGGVAPYLEKEGYDFPVLLAIDYLQELGVNGIPQTWLIDARGHVRKKNMGFGSELAEEWVADVKKQVEALGAEAPSVSEGAE